MAKLKGSVYVILDVVGMVLLTAGALGVMGMSFVNQKFSEIMLASGIILIAASLTLISIGGSRLRKEVEEFKRFDEIRENARLVPNNLKEGYIIDYTAEPSRAISYRNNEPEPETVADDSGDDIMIIYPE